VKNNLFFVFLRLKLFEEKKADKVYFKSVDIMATSGVEEHSCVTPNCDGKAKLRCPNCVKLGRRFNLIFYVYHRIHF
jgi:hypothetical protein